MKKMMLVMAAGAMLTAAVAHADTVTSVNVVGYYSVTIPNNQQALVSPVLEGFGSSATIVELLGEQLPANSKAYLWDRTDKSYKTFNYFVDFGGNGYWEDGAGNSPTNIIIRGDAFWVKPTDGSGEVTVTFMGEVPASYNAASTTTVSNIDAVDAVGYSYPVDIAFTNTSLYASPELSGVYFWNGTGYDVYNKFVDFGGNPYWDPAGLESKVVKAGEAFWAVVDSPIEWVESAPYDL